MFTWQIPPKGAHRIHDDGNPPTSPEVGQKSGEETAVAAQASAASSDSWASGHFCRHVVRSPEERHFDPYAYLPTGQPFAFSDSQSFATYIQAQDPLVQCASRNHEPCRAKTENPFQYQHEAPASGARRLTAENMS